MKTDVTNMITTERVTEDAAPIITTETVIDDVTNYTDDKVVTLQTFLTQPNDMTWATKFGRFTTALDYFVTPF